MRHFKLFLKTLISNNACVEAARTREKKYNIAAIIFALVALFLSVLPTAINSFKKSGSDWVSSYTYGVDVGLFNFTNDSQNTIKEENKLVFKVVKDSKTNSSYLENVSNWNDFTNDTTKDGKKMHEEPTLTDAKTTYDPSTYHSYKRKISAEGQIDNYFEVFYYDDTTDKSDENFIKFVTYIISGLNPFTRLKAELEKKSGESIDDSNHYLYYTEKEGKRVLQARTTSFMAFGKKRVFGYSYKSTSTSAVANFGGDYSNMQYENLLDSMKGDTYKASLNAWKEFFNKSYLNTRWTSSWTSIGIMCGVNGGVILFMGLMVFILTRGKNNPFRIYSFWDGQKIAYYASFTPGVLGMALSFAITNMAMMFFVLFFGVRVMWLSMRTLKPAQ